MDDGRDPGWRADPTGRHDLRWWDGERWTDRVSASGPEQLDPYDDPNATMATAPEATQVLPPVGPPVWQGQPDPTVAMPMYEREIIERGPAPLATPAPVPPKKTNTWLIVAVSALGALVVALLIALIVTSGDDDDETPTTTTTPTTAAPSTTTAVTRPATTTPTTRAPTTTEAPTTTPPTTTPPTTATPQTQVAPTSSTSVSPP